MNDHKELYTTTDPKTGLPALTTMLYHICDNNAAKFEDACRLVALFIEQAKKGE